MTITRIVSALTGIAIGFAALTTAHLLVAPPAQASLGCCMTRVDYASEWLQGKQSFKQCKEENAKKDGKKDKLLKKSGLVWWNIRC